MHQVYLAQSPLQVISAAEARHAFRDATSHVLIIMLSPTRAENNQQVLQAVYATEWQHVHLFHPKTYLPLHALITKWRVFRMLRNMRPSHGTSRLFLGDFRSLWMHRARAFLQPAETWLMDDGSITAVIQRDYLNRGVFFPAHKKGGLQAWIKPLLYRLMNTQQVASEPLHVFSCFPVDPPLQADRRLIRHHFEGLRAASRKQYRTTGQVLFFGTKLSETGVLAREQELAFIRAIAQQYRLQGMTMSYVPHRGDSPEKLARITSHDITLKPLGMPAELYLISAQELPTGIATFNSSVLTTLTKLAEFDIVEAFQIPLELFSDDKRAQQQHAYELLRAQGISIHVIAMAP